MDGTLETLNIQITADTRKAESSITSLKSALGRLDQSLGSFRNIGNFSQGMTNVATAINDISSSINSINITKIQSLADAMKTLSSATKGIARGTGNLSFTKVESEANGFKKEIDSMTKSIQKDFGISNSNVDGLRERIVALAKSTNELATSKDPTNANALFEEHAKNYAELQSYIERTKRVVGGFNSAYQSVVDAVKSNSSGMKVSIKSMVSEVGEDYDKLRRKISNTNFTTKETGFGFDSWIKSLSPETMSVIDSEIQTMGGRIGDLTSQFNAVVSIMERWRESNRSGVAEMSMINSTAEGLQGTVNGVVQSFETLSMAEGRVASIGQTETVNAFHSMAEGLNQFQSVSLTNVGQISELASAIKTLGYASSEKAIVNIPKLAVALNGLMETLSKAPTVSANVNKLLNSLARFNESMKVYNATARSTKASNGSLNNSFLNLNKGVRKANTGFKGLASTIGKIYATYWLFFRLFSKFGEAINISSQLTEVENVVNQTFGDMRSKIDEFASTSINKFGMSELALKQYASRFQAMGTAMNITGSMLESTTSVLGDAERQYGKLTGSMAEMSVNLTKLTADIASFYDVEQSAVAEDLYSVFTGQTRSLRQYGIDLTEVNLKEWAMKKGLDANFDAMTQAQKAALRYAYTLDAAKYAMGDFERTSDTWANSVRILKANLQQLAIVIGTGFINALKPLLRGLDTALQAITSFATKVLNALGQIFGWKYEINLGGITTELDDAAGYSDDLSDGLGGAANNAKELNKQLRGFDKLNVLTSDKDNGGGGKGSSASGGGGGALDDSNLIKAAKVGEAFYESTIKDLEHLGQYISDAISHQIESINWKDVYEKARSFGTGLADFLNGMFTDTHGNRLFRNLGTYIANSINTVMNAADAFADKFKFGGLGDALAKGIKGFFKNWNAGLTGEVFGEFVAGISNTIYAVVSDQENWKLLGSKIAEGINGVIKGLNKVDPLTGKTGWEALFGDVALIANGLREALETAVENIDWSGVWKGVGKGLMELPFTMDKDTFFMFVPTLQIEATFVKSLENIIEASEAFRKRFIELFFNYDYTKELLKSIKDRFAKIKDSKDLKEIGKNIVLGILDGFKAAFSYQIEPFTDLFNWIVDSIKSIFDINSPSERPEVKDIGKYIVLGILNGFSLVDFYAQMNQWWNQNVAPWFSNVDFSSIKDKISDSFSGALDNVHKVWGDIGGWFTKNVTNPISQKFGTMRTDLSSKFSTLRTEITTNWGTLGNWFSTNVTTPLSTSFQNAMSRISSSASSIVSSVRSSFNSIKDAVNGAISVVNSLFGYNNRTFTINSGLAGLVNALSSAWSLIQSIFSKNNQTVTIRQNTVRTSTTKADGGVFKNGRWHDIAQYASGGLPTTGQMFIAREAGPELVGRLGGGTAVMNNDQIVASVSAGVYKAVASAMRQYGGTNVSVMLQGDAQDLFRAVQTESYGYYGRTGRTPFPT